MHSRIQWLGVTAIGIPALRAFTSKGTPIRSLSLLGVLLFAAFGPYGVRTAHADPPADQEQITIKLEQAVLAKDAFKGVKLPALVELLQKGLVAADTPREIRTDLAARVAEGRITVIDTLNVTTLAGVAARFIPSESKNSPVLGGSIVPRLSGGRLTVEVDLIHGPKNGRVHTGHSVRNTVSLADGGIIMMRFADGKDSRKEHLVLVTVSRVAPAADPAAAGGQ